MEGTQVGAYRIVQQIGEGGMGSVWLAEHTMLGRRAAVKLLHPSFTSRPEIVQRFFNEARAATSISDPGIVQVFDFGHHTDGQAYIVMELLEGEPLDRRLQRQGKLAVNDVVTSVTAGSGMAASITNNGLSVGLTTSCAANQVLKYVSNNWTCQNDADTPPTAGNGIAVSGNTVSLATTNCLNGFVWKFSSGTNTFTCAADADTPPTGTAPIAVSGSRVVSLTNCAAGEVYKMNPGGNAWICAPDANTTYTAGTGITITNNTIAPDTAVLQRRVTGTCADGAAIRVIAADGTVTCQVVGPGNSQRFTNLNNSSVTVSATPTALGIGGPRTFTKQRADTNLELVLYSRINSGTFSGASNITYDLRIGGVASTVGTVHRTFSSQAVEYVTLHAVFQGLAAGQHTVTVSAQTDGGTSTSVVVDPSGHGGAILVKEY
jgi:hypothetical protein